jgi:hypothetical protein
MIRSIDYPIGPSRAGVLADVIQLKEEAREYPE